MVDGTGEILRQRMSGEGEYLHEREKMDPILNNDSIGRFFKLQASLPPPLPVPVDAKGSRGRHWWQPSEPWRL